MYSHSEALAEPNPRTIKAAVFCLGAFAIAAGLVTLAGWFGDYRRPTDWLGNGIPMFPNTAVAAICAGVSLMLFRSKSPGAIFAGVVLAGMVTFIGAATLFEHLFGMSIGIDTLLFRQ